ncbi:retrovirus-related Pol polyprotein from transposon 412 [Trichonephila clavata]|uniref:Retrovirus-related Pol polyprotein from transposon 412 n=1 Tax=Trichonephila clavata TaxID=2740835 RepID=A0A8X6J1G5_TRICU|nr:retrovirus-related Pol polyprotein from transposon 412 [Trichonephila clavata]
MRPIQKLYPLEVTTADSLSSTERDVENGSCLDKDQIPEVQGVLRSRYGRLLKQTKRLDNPLTTIFFRTFILTLVTAVLDSSTSSNPKLKDAITSAPILAYPEARKQFILDIDASHESIGAVLSQETDGQERVITYFSKCLSRPERNYCLTRKELLAIVKAVEHFHPYLYGRRFLLRTDHASLTWLLNFKNPEGQVARWIQRLQEYDVEIRHIKGSAHGNADVLSRRPCPERCKYCSRVEE